MAKTIEISVTGNYVTGDNVVIGAVGCNNSTDIKVTFNTDWSEYHKYVTLRDALGENPTVVVLTDAEHRVAEGVYQFSVPASVLTKAGMMLMTFKGYTLEQVGDNVYENEAELTAAAYFRVLKSGFIEDESALIAASVAQQLLAAINGNTASIGAVNAKIPTEASSANKLADKAYVSALLSTLRGIISDNATSANKATDKAYVDGLMAALTQSLSAHTGNTSNPHGVTAEQLNLSDAQIRAIVSAVAFGGALSHKLTVNGTEYDNTEDVSITIGTDPTVSSDVAEIKSKIPQGASSANKLADKAFVNALIAAINDLIPSAASANNKLADKAFVNSSIQTNTATFRGSYSTWAAVPDSVSGYPYGEQPTKNDYMVVLDTSDYGDGTKTGTWRFKYDKDEFEQEGKSGWIPEYQVNREPLTQAQIAALNSGITSALVAILSAGLTTGGALTHSITINNETFNNTVNKELSLVKTNYEYTDSTYGTVTVGYGQTGLTIYYQENGSTRIRHFGKNGVYSVLGYEDDGEFIVTEGIGFGSVFGDGNFHVMGHNIVGNLANGITINGQTFNNSASKSFTLANAPTTTTVTIAVADWAGGTTCTKSVTGVTANSIVFCDASNAAVQCSEQGVGTLTFTATATPTESVTVKVVNFV